MNKVDHQIYETILSESLIEYSSNTKVKAFLGKNESIGNTIRNEYYQNPNFTIDICVRTIKSICEYKFFNLL